MKRSISLGLVVVFVFSSLIHAAVTLPAMFSDHMVLQRGVDVPVWGTANASEKVAVEYAGKVASATADANGKWSCKLSALPLGDAASLTIKAEEGDAVIIKDVFVGDVWICSGQSNMGFQVKSGKNAEKEIAAANYPNIRMFKVPNVTSVEPTTKLAGDWKICTPENVGDFTAVGYFFGRQIHMDENVPVGLINNAWGGMPAESFTSKEMLESDADFKPLLDRKVGSKTPNAPSLASNIYNAMVFPLIPYAVKGAIWYQGESNADRAEQYRKLFPAMIEDWRKRWGEGDFPFFFVQLANYSNGHARSAEPSDSNWAELREAQTMTLKASPNTGMAVIIDIGESKDIHPKNKQDVGKRLALAAEKMVYGKNDTEWSGPMYESMSVDGDSVKLKFSHADGLVARDGDAKGFSVAGEDQKFHWATAKIDGGDVIVSSKDVAKPVAVRYGWADDPEVNVFNGAGLPMCPFRTDDWKMVTAGKK